MPHHEAEIASEPDPLAAGELGLITRAVALATGAQTGLIAAFDATDRLIDVLSAWGAVPGQAPLPATLPADSFIARVVETGHPAVEQINPECDPGLAITATGRNLTHVAGAAVRPPGGPPGALCVGLAERPRDGALTLWQVESYARLAALCLYDQGVLAGLIAASRRDGLTGCLNHAGIHDELHREITRATRHGRNMACCFIDLDGFKQVNDRHGHPHGNRVLARVAAVLRHALRDGDSLGRYGGDEFIALMPDTDQAEARVLAERLRATISSAQLGPEPLDSSIGVAQWRPGSTVDELLEDADDALMTAKLAGGGVVVTAEVGRAARTERKTPGAAPAWGTARRAPFRG